MSFRTRFLLATTAILIVTVVALIVAADRWLRQALEGSLAGEIEREARLVAAALPADSASLQAAARRMGTLVGRRVSVIDSAGRVVADSDFDERSVALLGSQLGQPEVSTALAGRAAVVRRHSETTGRTELNVAVPAPSRVVRISAPVAEVDATVNAAQRAVLLAAVLALLVGVVLAALTGRALAQPLDKLATAARNVAQGGPATYPASQAPEIRQLVRAFRDMQEQISERIDALERRREESTTLLESMAEGVIAADARGGIQLCSPAARTILGYADDDRLPDLRELFHQREAREVVEQVLEGHAVAGVETSIEGRTILLTGRPLPDGGAVLGLLDATDLKRLQAVRRDFVANVSHELKTPLTSIFGYAETLLVDPPDEKTAKRFLSTIRDNAERMRRLVDDLLDLARLETGGWRPTWGTLVLSDVVDEAWEAVQPRARERRATLHKEFDSGSHLAADAEALREILVNLFDNAVRHSPDGGTITVRFSESGTDAIIEVVDHGTGIPAEHVERVFERFYRVDVGRSRAEGGTGLGLAIVKHFVEAHGGSVSLESEIGRGTTVSLRFPSNHAAP